jgi:hypothetical protein
MVRTVTEKLDVVIPIISFKEVSRSDWRYLPQLVHESIARPPDMVVCSHLDQVCAIVSIFSRMIYLLMYYHTKYMKCEKELRTTVASVFWKSDPSKINSVLACSSRLGLSARLLLRKSRFSKPDYDEIYDVDSIESYVGVPVCGYMS